MKTILETQQLSKHFGKVKAVQNLDLSVTSGQVFGLLGPNGSGKTTTLGMILGVLNPTSGNYLWYGKPGSHIVRQKIGAILEHPIFFPHLSATQNLKIAARIKNVENGRIDEVLDWVGLADRKDDAFKTFSLGMKQRLAIASALLSDPEVLILDEPTNGLDPLGIADIRALIKRIAADGKTIILASHLLDEVQKVCTDFGILYKGKLIFSGSVSEELGNDQFYEVSAADIDTLHATMGSFQVDRLERLEDRIRFQSKASGAEINAFLIKNNIIASEITPHKKTLENQFLNLVAAHEKTV